MIRLLAAAVAAAALTTAQPAAAHELLLEARAEGTSIMGTVSYGEGVPEVGGAVELFDLSRPDQAAAATTTDEQGRFRFDVTPGRRYRVVAHADEGHTTRLEVLAPAA